MTFRILLSLLLLTVCAYGQGAGSVAVVPTVAELTNRPPSALNPVVSVSGYRTNGDWGPARTMRYVPTSTQAIDNGCVFPTVTGTGRWEAADCDGPSVSVAYYGTYADNESNDSDAFSAAFNRAVQWRGESGGGVVYVPAGDYRVNWNMATPLANEDSITITGDGPGATALRPWTNTAPVLKLLGRNITVEKLMLKGDILTPQGVGLQLGDTNLATGAVVAANFRDLYILDFTTGLYIEGIDQAHFDGMVIQRCTNGLLASPRWYATSGTNAVMSKVKFTRSVWLGNYGDAITLRGGYCEQIDFDTCVIEQNYGKAMVFQQYNPISGNPFRGIQIRNCFFEFNNNSAPAGDYYDIEFQPAVGTGANAIYSSMIEGCWFQTTRSSHTPIRILNGGDYRIQNNDFISNNSYFISVTNSPVIDLDVSFAKVLVEAGSSPQINWVNANRVELKGITNATPSLILTNTGRLLFSDGVNAPDLNVYRSAARVLAAEGTFRSIGTAASDQAFLASVSGDALGRFTALNSGRFEWGDGAGARNIFMERSGSGIMEMKGACWTFNRANSTDWALQLYATGDTQYRLSLRADGRMEWSDGANPAGISLAPVSGNILNLLATYRIQRTNATDSAMLTGVLGESASRFEVDSAGRMSWGDGTGPRLHGSLERTAAGELTLKTNLVIAVGGGLTINGERVTDWTGSGLSIVGGALTSAGAADGDKGDITVSGSGATWTIDADSVALGTDTTGDYVASVSGTANEVGASGSGEGAAVTVSLPATIDLGGKTSFELPNGAAPTVDAFGEIAGDNDAWGASRGAPVFYDGTAAVRLVGVLDSDTPSAGQVPKWQTGGTITWEDDSTGGGGISDGDKGDITVSGSGAIWTIDADSVALSTDTTGNYVASVTGTANEVSASGSGEGAAVTVGLPATVDLGGKTSFELPNGAAPTVDAFGEIAGDNDAWGASRGAPVFYDGTAAVRLVGVLASDTPSAGQVPKWQTGGTITWEDDTGSASGYLPLTAGLGYPLSGDLHFDQSSDVRVAMLETGKIAEDWYRVWGLRAYNGLLYFGTMATNDFTWNENWITFDPSLDSGASNRITFGDSGYNNSVAFEADVILEGDFTVNGSVSGLTEIATLLPQNSQPPSSSYATFATRNSIGVLEFDASAQEATRWVIALPKKHSYSGGVTITIEWCTTATSGDGRWGARVQKLSAVDIDSDSFATAVEATTTTSGTAGLVNRTTLSAVGVDSAAEGDLVQIEVYRDVGDAADTINSNDIQILAVVLEAP